MTTRPISSLDGLIEAERARAEAQQAVGKGLVCMVKQSMNQSHLGKNVIQRKWLPKVRIIALL